MQAFALQQTLGAQGPCRTHAVPKGRPTNTTKHKTYKKVYGGVRLIPKEQSVSVFAPAFDQGCDHKIIRKNVAGKNTGAEQEWKL